MPKNIEDIIVPERKRSIRNIPIPESRRKANEYSAPFNRPSPPPPPPPSSQTQPHGYQYPPETKREEFDFHREGVKFLTPPWRGRKSLWISIAVAIIILLLLKISFLLSGEVEPVNRAINSSSMFVFSMNSFCICEANGFVGVRKSIWLFGQEFNLSIAVIIAVFVFPNPVGRIIRVL